MRENFFLLLCGLGAYIICTGQQPSQEKPAPVPTQKNLDSPDNKIYVNPTVAARFPNGEEGWKKFVADNLNTGIPVINNAPAGRYTVVVRCIVSYWGSIIDVMAESKHGYGMEKEVITCLKRSPRWKPAFHAGRPVNSFVRQEVSFEVPGQ